MKFFQKKEKDPEKELDALLFELRELIKDPPTQLDMHDWERDLDLLTKKIRSLSLNAFEKLEDLILELQKRGAQHVRDLDDEASPAVLEASSRLYFEQVAFLNSEIQSLT